MLQSSLGVSRDKGAASAFATGARWRNALPMTPGRPCATAASPCGLAVATTGAGLVCGVAVADAIGAALWLVAKTCAGAAAAGFADALTRRAAVLPVPISAKP